MTRPSLAGIEQRTAAATEGPWEVDGPDEQWAAISSGPDSVIHAYAVHDRDCEGCTCGGDEAGHVAISVEDAEFIAHTRTDLPALTAPAPARATTHQPQPYGREGAPPFVLRLVCDHCLAQYDGAVEHPCPTVRALATHLDLTDPEGEPT